MKELSKNHFRLLRVLHNRTRGFVLVEILLVALVIGIIFGIFFYAIKAGETSFFFSSARNTLQAEVRRTISWIVKDARQAVSWDMANNSPAAGYIKFRQVTGWDTVNNTFSLSNYYVEYAYNAANSTIVRRTSDLSNNTIGTWTLNNIITAPFFTRDSSGSIVVLNQADLLTSKQLIITISGQAQAWGAQNTDYSLTEEVQIRNG